MLHDKEFYMHSRFFSKLATLILFSATVYGQQAFRNPKKEQVICEKLAAMAPGAVETFQRATAAMDKRDYQQAVSLYREVAKQAREKRQKTWLRGSTRHFLRCGLEVRPKELRRFSAILAVIQRDFSATKTVWRRGKDFEPSVQLSSARHYREHKEVKSGSQSLRFVIAKNSSTRFAKSDLSSGPGENAR
jgi:hypothetical protein